MKAALSLSQGNKNNNHGTRRQRLAARFAAGVLSLLMALTLALPANVWGQQQELTICGENTTTNEYVPIYGFYCDEKSKVEFIIPAEKLNAMNGGSVSAMKFYLSSSNSTNDISTTFNVFVKEVNATTLTAFTGTTNATIVYSSTISIAKSQSNIELNIPFSSNYVYRGGNLLVGVYQTGNTSYNHTYWTGENQSGNTAWQAYGSGSGSGRSFLPKTTFTYEIITTPTISIPSTATVLTGFTTTLTATTLNVTGTPSISYSSSNTNVATVSGSGTSATVTGVSAGTATITATMTVNGTPYTAQCAITVEDPSYCTPGTGNWDNDGIYNVTFGTNPSVNNTVAGIAYGDYSNLAGAVNAGATCQVDITYKTGYTYGTIIWVDWNQNYTFEGTEAVYAGTSGSTNPTTLNATFTVPAATSAGDYRMRIIGSDMALDSYTGSLSAAANADPCGSYNYSTCHDYTLRVNQPTTCDISITLTDAYGDGGGSVQVLNTNTNETLVSYTLDDSEETYTLTVYDGTPLSFVYTSTDNWPYENGYVITAPNGAVLAQHVGCSDEEDCSAPDNGVITTYTVNCSEPSTPNPCDKAIPYTYGFEDATDFSCWTTQNCEECSNNNSLYGLYISSSYANNGDNLFVFSSYCGETEPQYLISPELSGVANGVHVEFSYAIVDFSNAPETFQVGYSTTNNNANSFTWVDSRTINSSSYEQFTANYMGAVKYVAVKYTSQDSYYLLVDDFSITEVPSCLEPTNVIASNETTTSATIDWTAGGSESSWDLYYTSNASIAPSTNTTPSISGITTTSQNLTELSPATTYYVYVRSSCSNSEKSAWSTPGIFHTECNAMSLPYSETFEDGALTVCWTPINESVVYMSTQISTTAPYEGTYHLNLDRRTPNGTQILVLPEVSSSYALNDYIVTFYAMLSDGGYSNYTSSNRTLAVGIMTDPSDASTFVQVGDAVEPTDSYAEYTFDLSNYSGNGRYIAIKHDETTSGNNGYTFIDNLTVTPSTHTITVTASPAEGGTVTGGGTYNNGETATLTATANTGYTFSQWSDGNTSNPRTVTVTGAATYTAVFDICPAPTDLEASQITANTANLSWTGNSDSYTAKYRIPAHIDGISEEFNSVPPTGWAKYSGLLSGVLDGTATLTSTSSGWSSNTNVFNTHPKLNIYGTSCKYWLVTPSITLSNENSQCAFDLALTDYNNSDPIEDATAQADDKFVVLITTDNGSTWTILRQWDNAGSTNVYNSISTTGEAVSIDLSAYNGQNVKIAFYGESTASGGDNDLHIDNVTIGVPVPATPWQTAETSENSVEISGLQSETTYEAQVFSDCNAEGSEIITFTTECDAITTYPWTENFDSYIGITSGTSNNLTDCWNYINTSTYSSYKGYPVIYNGSSYSHSGNNHLRFYSYGYSSYDPQDQYAILPPMENLAGKQITLYARGYNTSSTFKIGIMSNPRDASTFTEIATQDALTTSYQEFIYYVPANAQGKYIAIMMEAASGSDYRGIYIDDITIDNAPTCRIPTDLTIDNITANSAELSWTENGTATAWQICLNGDEDHLINVTTNPYSLTGLSAHTTYTAIVRAYCDDDDQSYWPNPITFSTDCGGGSLISANGCEDFETGCLLSEWTNEGASAWTVGTGDYSTSTGASTGTYNAKINHGTTGNETYLVSPAIDFSNASSAYISFSYINRKWSSDIDGFGVYYRVNGGEWNELFSTAEAHSSWTEETIELTGLAANYQVGFKFTDGYGYGVGLDDICFTSSSQTISITTTGGEWTYDGTAHTATVEVSPSVEEGTTLQYSTTSAEGPWSNNVPSITDAGSMTVYVKASHAGYPDAITNCTLTVNPKAVNVIAENKNKTYGSTDPTLTAIITDAFTDEAVTANISYTMSRGEGENVGEYEISITLGDNPNYSITPTSGTFTINAKAVTITVANASKTYGADDPDFTGTVEGLVNANDLGNITYSRTNDDEDVDTYENVLTANYTANDNYSVTVVPGDFTINAKAVTITVADASKTYGADDPDFTGTVEGLVNANDLGNITYTRTNNAENVGTYNDVLTANYTANSNYSVTVVPGDFTINAKAVTITVADASKTYGAADPTFTGTVEGLVNANDLGNITYSRTSNDENVGTYNDVLTASYTANSNYSVTVVPGDFTINAKAVIITVANASKTYGADDPDFTGTVEGLVNANDLGNITYTRTNNAENVGTYNDVLTANYTANSNYNVTVVPGDFTINKAEIAITVTGNTDSKVYNGTAQSVTGYTLNCESSLFNASKVVFSGNVADSTATGTDAGTYMMELDAEQFIYNDANIDATFTIAEDGKLTITPIDVTVTITGANNTADYDGQAHTVTGYTATASSTLYDVENDFTFSGTASATRTDAGTTSMNLAAGQFANTNTNFGTVTFNVTDGYQAITPIDVTVTITGANNTADYDGQAHTVTGYTATASSTLYDVENDFTFSGTASATRTDAGTTSMNLAAGQFANTNTNFGTVTFNVTDGYQAITPIDVTVTITGANNTADYDGQAHTVTGYTATASSTLYDVENDFTFSGTASATRTDAGTTSMNLAAGQFTNTNSNFTATFEVTDGYQTITPIDVTVTITGANNTADYDGQAHTVTGYTATASSTLYDVENDFTFSGTATATRTDAGTTSMNLAATQFTNTNTNFGTVTFNVTDGYQTITPINVTVTITGANNTADYDGQAHTVTGYTATASSSLYDVENDFTFSGTASATRTDAGTTSMNLAAGQFTNTNSNFTATFEVTDGYITVNGIDVIVTITGTVDTANYDGEAHTANGYTVDISDPLYTTNDFTFSGTATATRTNVVEGEDTEGTTYMGMAIEQFTNNNPSFNVTFKVFDGHITISPINATVTITGNHSTVAYDGAEHTTTGYTATASTALYNVNSDFTFSGDATATRTDAGTTSMNLAAGQFANTNTNFGTVTFNVTDGYQTITPIDVTVTITGANSTVDFDGAAHTVTGYTATTTSTLYNVNSDFTFSGDATATRTDAGTTSMNLAAGQFANTNTNFGTVTFNVTDGYQTITPATLAITVTGNTDEVVYNGQVQSVTGYTATSQSSLFDATKVAYSSNANASGTTVGEYAMGLNADLFTYNDANIDATFSVTDGKLTINPLAVTVTIAGAIDTVDYDGTAHTVNGYTATANSNLYRVSGETVDFTFNGEATANRTSAGTTYMELSDEQFTNTNENFNVTFRVTDGHITVEGINVTVTITGTVDTASYDGEPHTANGYTVVISNPLYTTNDFTFNGTAEASQTTVGTAYMGLTAGQFENTNPSFTVTFNVTDGHQTINPIDVTVTIVGNTNSTAYNGEEHSVSGYTATASTELYTANDFTFSGEAEAARTNVDTTFMGLAANQFANTNPNFATVTFNVTDGYQAITPINATVTIVGNTNSTAYNGEEHSVSGYTATASTELYNVNSDFTFNGTAEAARTNVDTTFMGLAANQFANTNPNFATVTFNVTDGYQAITPINATVTITGANSTVDFDGAAHTVTGYTATTTSTLYNVNSDFTFTPAENATLVNGVIAATRTEAGTTNMGLAANQFANTNPNFATVTFEVTDGYITVNAVDVVVTIKGRVDTVTYDGTAHTVTGYTATANSTLYNVEEDFSFTGTTEPTASQTTVGTAYMGLTDEQFENTNENFASVTFNVTDGHITVNPKAITIAAVDNSKVYGGTEPTLTATVTGVPENGADPVYTVGRATGETVGTYAITVTASADANPNYNITTADGVFTITKATATVTASSLTKDYGQDDPALTATVSGLQNGDAESVINYTLARAAGDYVGTYTITPSGAAVQGNYDVVYQTGTLTIRPTVVFTTDPMPTSICSEGSISVAFDATIAGNNGNVTFAWSRNHTDDVTGTASGTGNINVALTAAATQTVTFTVTPTFNPTEGEAVEGTPATFDVTVNALPAVTTQHVNVNCAEMGSATITVTSTGTFTCAWNNGTAAALTQQDNDGHYYTHFGNLSEGDYPYVVTDANGCVTSGVISVEDPGRISVSQSISGNETCENTGVTVNYVIEGGTDPYTLTWMDADNDIPVEETEVNSLTGSHNFMLPVGEYRLAMSIMDTYGCAGTASDTLTIVVKPIRTIVREININLSDPTYEYNGHTYNSNEVPPTETYTAANGCDSIISYVVNSYPLDILIADNCTLTRSSYTRAYSNTPRNLLGDTLYVRKNSLATFYAYLQDTELTQWNDEKMDMTYELLFNESGITDGDMPSLVSNFSISSYYDKTGQYYGIANLTAATGEIPNNTLAFRQTANSSILHFDYFYFDAFKNIPNKVTLTGLENGTYTLKLKAELRHSTGGTNRAGIYNPYIVGRKYGHLWGGYNDRPGNREVIAARTFTIIVNETGTNPQHSNATTDIADYTNEASVMAFPNPVNDQLNLRISGMSGATLITITDAHGKVVRTLNAELYGSEEVLTYNVADFAQGMYFINVRNNDTQVSEKFVVTHR